MIYFITDGLNIKIGTARNIKKRLSQMKAGNPHRLTLLAQCEGGREMERDLHNLFFDRVPGSQEWYFPTRSLLRFIARVRTLGSVAADRRIAAKYRLIRISRAKSDRAAVKFSADFVRLICELSAKHGDDGLAKMVGVTKSSIGLSRRGDVQMGALNIAKLGTHYPDKVKALFEGRLYA